MLRQKNTSFLEVLRSYLQKQINTEIGLIEIFSCFSTPVGQKKPQNG